MICAQVLRNGVLVCNAGISDACLITAHISGGRYDDDAASFAVSGMQMLPDGRKTHVYCISDTALSPTDHMSFALVESNAPSAPVEIIATDSSEYIDSQREYDELLDKGLQPPAARPERWSALAFRLRYEDEEVAACVNEPEEHIMCSILWTNWDPEKCSVYVRSFPGAPSDLAGTEWFRAEMAPGEHFDVTVAADRCNQ